MNAMVLALWLATIVLDTVGQLAFKAAAADPAAGDGIARWRYMLDRRWIWIGCACYALEFFAWIAFLSQVPLGEGVLLGSISIVGIALAGKLIFGERLGRLRIVGISLIGLGVATVGAGT